MARKFSDTVMKLLELGKPYYLNGVWHPPKITRKEMREIRKVMILDGEAWPIKFLKDRGLDKDKPYTREKKRAERQAKIEENMRKMPQMVAEYRANAQARRKAFKKKWTEDETYRLATGKPLKEGFKEKTWSEGQRKKKV